MSENYNTTYLTISEDLPKVCPACGHELSWSGADLICANELCSSKAYNKLYRFISVVGCNGIKNIGQAMIDELIRAASVRVRMEYREYNTTPTMGVYIKRSTDDMIDFYNGTYFEDNFGPVTADKYKAVVKNMFFNPIDKDLFLYAMNIPGLGWEKCQTIVQSGVFDQILKDDDAWRESLRAIKGMGSSVIESIDRNLIYIQAMASLVDHNFNKVVVENTSSIRYVTVTGSLSISRSKFDELIKSYGWAVDSNIKNSEYLVTNNPDPTSSKGKKAKELGKTIITEQEFYKLIGVSNSTPQGAITVGELA